MAGTTTGGKKAAEKNKANDPSFYAKIGAKGGKNGRTGGFYNNPELARRAGAIGGKKSRRKKQTIEKPEIKWIPVPKLEDAFYQKQVPFYGDMNEPVVHKKKPNLLQKMFGRWL